MNFFTSLWRQRNYRVAIIVTLVALAWLLSGVLGPENHRGDRAAERSAALANEEPMLVLARRIQAQPYTTRVLVNGHTEPNRSVRLRAELDGVIVGTPVAEGRMVEKGEVICKIDPQDRPEKLEQARAALRKAELDYAGAERLRKKGLQSGSEMAQREVSLANARAEYKRASVDVENLQVRAPFPGVVNQRAVELGDFIRRGEECATLLDLDPLLVVGEVAESSVGALIPGAPGSARLQRGQLVQGKLRYVSQQADDQTRAYRVEVAVENTAGTLRGGLSGQLALPTGEVAAHRINSSLLTLDDRGDLGVRTVDEDNRVQFHTVELVGDGDEGIWVTGLPEQVTLITVGQEYVTAGDLVRLQIESGESDLPAPSAAMETEAEQPVVNTLGSAPRGVEK